METLFLLAMICLVLFMILATYDGAYLHLWKYELFNHNESLFEHKTHTVRAILFPFIIWLLFIDTTLEGFLSALILVALDFVVLAVDAYSEKDSRKFMNGLPRWEYIIHLFANGFHFATIILLVATRIEVEDFAINYSEKFIYSMNYPIASTLAINILPGAIILAIMHLFLSSEIGKQIWNKIKGRSVNKIYQTK